MTFALSRTLGPGDRSRTGVGNYSRYIEYFWVIFLAVSLTRFTVLQPRTATSLELAVQGDLTKQVGYILLFLAVAIPSFIVRGSRAFSSFPSILFAFFVWAGLTISWSPVADIASRRLILTLLISATVLLSVSQIPPIRTVRLTAAVLAWLVLASLISGVLFPSLAIHQSGDTESGVIGDWRGLFFHKNIFGSVAALSAMFELNLAMITRANRRHWGMFALSAFAIVLSGSKTSLGLALFAGGFSAIWFYASRSRFALAWAQLGLFLSPLLVAGVVWALVGPGAEILSDPASFTGRSAIWKMMFALLAEHPIGGLGYQSVFQTGAGGVMAKITGSVFFQSLTHAHNGYLEIAVSTGLVGLFLLLWFIWSEAVVGLKRIDPEFRPLAPLLTGLLVFILAHSMMEVGFADRDRSTWLMLLMLVGLIRAMRASDRGCRREFRGAA